MSIEENKALVRHHYNLLNRGDIDASYKHIAPECVFHMPDGDLSLEQGKKFDTTFFEAFPDFILTIEDLIAEGDKVVERLTWRGTHKDELRGIALTGKKIEITNSNWIRVVYGELVEYWGTSDRLSFMQQLGSIPSQS